MWVRDGIGLIPQANIAFTNPWGPRKLVLCSFAPSAGFISGTKCQVSQFFAISAEIRKYFYQKVTLT